MEQLPGGRREAVDASEENTLDGGRHVDGGGVGGAQPLTAGAGQHARRDQVSDDLLQVEGVAARPLDDDLAQPCRKLGGGGSEEGVEDRSAVLLGEVREPKRGETGAACGQGANVEPRPASAEDDKWAVAQPVRHDSKPFDGGGVGPMEILHDEEEGSLAQPALEDQAQEEKDLALGRLGLDLRELVARLEPEHVAEDRRHTSHLVLGDAEGPETVRDLLARHGQGVVRSHSVALAEEPRDDAVGLLAHRRARGLAHGDARDLACGIEPSEELSEEA